MIHPELHTQPVALDREQHRLLRLRNDVDDQARFAQLNSSLVLAGEFSEACKDYPLLWIRAGSDDKGEPQVAPIAVFGLTKQGNLCIDGGRWRTRHIPVLMQIYPFAAVRSAVDAWTLCYDASSPRFSLTSGEPLFNVDGTPSALTLDVQKQVEFVEADVERTRLLGRELLQRDLLRDMRFQVDVPGGDKLGVDGFLTVDEQRFAALSDADVLVLHRSGFLLPIHAHLVSLSNMRRLAQWHLERLQAAA
ncbi:MAG TPA: SapC family protein [Burkholderiaceae bacterium]|nr:SapC family protein [Burkholderiaceae bacterium]HSB99480.1 SapC family protein [Burkholderiaceae bacterium]